MQSESQLSLTFQGIVDRIDFFTPPSSSKCSVCFYGPTGSGKSTFINYALGNQMKFEVVRGKYCIDKVDPQQSGPAIGHEVLSETSEVAWYDWEDSHTLVDLMGSGDTRNVETEIYNAWAFQKVLHRGLNMKFVFVVSLSDLLDMKGYKFLNECLKPLTEMFENDFPGMEQSFAFCVTKVIDFTKEEVIAQLKQMIASSGLFSEPIKAMLEKVIKEDRLATIGGPNSIEFDGQIELAKSLIKMMNSYELKCDSKLKLSQNAVHEVVNLQQKLHQQYMAIIKSVSRNIEDKVSLWRSNLDESFLAERVKKIECAKELSQRLAGVQTAQLSNLQSIVEIEAPLARFSGHQLYQFGVRVTGKQLIDYSGLFSTLDVCQSSLMGALEEVRRVNDLERKRKQQEERQRQEAEQRRIAQEQIEQESKRREEELRRQAQIEHDRQIKLQEERQRREAEELRKKQEELDRIRNQPPPKPQLRPEQKIVRQVNRVFKKAFKW